MDLVPALLSVLKTGAALLIVLTVLVAVHELGHYLFARMFGMHVDAFAVMVGGVRKTNLREHLMRPLASPIYPALTGILLTIGATAGAFLGVRPLVLACLALLATVLPIWIIGRLNALYHRPLIAGLKTLFTSWAIVLLIIGLGTRFQHVDAIYALSMLLGGSACALLIVYYAPVLGAGDAEGNKGRGRIVVDDKEVPVQFRPLWSRTNRQGTEFSLLLLPLGGFAAIRGMHPREDGSETRIEGGFFSKKPIPRLLVLFAGPLFSVLLGIVLIFTFLMIKGMPDQLTNKVAVLVTGPAKAAGLQVNDTITAVNGVPVKTFYEVREQVQFSYDSSVTPPKPKPVTLNVNRDGQTLTFTFLPEITDKPEPLVNENLEPTGKEAYQAKLGMVGSPSYRPTTIREAATAAVLQPLGITLSLFHTFTNYSVAKESVGGPGAMVEQTQTAVQGGWLSVLEYAGLLSIFLGLLNLLPIPPLDGGQMVIAFAELLRGNRRLPMSVQVAVTNLGMVMVAALMLLVFVIDAGRRSELNEIRERTAVPKTR